MPTFKVPHYGDLHIPAWVNDFHSFRRWIHEHETPEKLRIHFIGGEIWTDFFMEELFSHSRVKTALGIALGGLIEGEGLGMYIPDGMLLTNAAAELATTPDAMFVSNDALEAGRVAFVAGQRGQAHATEMTGTPDLAIEIVSPSSEVKDTEWLMSAYHNAGIPEYWVIDARESRNLRFDVFARRPKGYVAARKSDGWAKSAILARSFRLSRVRGAHGFPIFQLEVR
jgi:Uma2 family endonuclease